MVLFAGTALAQSIFLDGGYVLPNRAAGMSAYVADPDFAHAALLNPARLASAYNMFIASDYEYFSRQRGELFFPNSSSQLFQNGKLAAWDVSAGFPVGPLGGGVAFSSFNLGGWRTTVSVLAVGVRLPLGFSAGVSGKYVTYSRFEENLANGTPGSGVEMKTNRFTFDLGAINRQVLANNTFFEAVLSAGAVFSNVLADMELQPQLQSANQPAAAVLPGNINVTLPQTFSCGIAYSFISNYRLADFELFKVTAAADYSHLFSNSTPIDELPSHRDQYRVGLETTALGILAVQVGYTLKAPARQGIDGDNNLSVARMGTGFSYGFSLRFPVKLLLPDLPVVSLELSYAKNPEWNSGMYQDLFGVVAEMQF